MVLSKAVARSLTAKDEFCDVHTYCMFIGYPRSGHSLFGALLDSHPNMVISHELDALRYVGIGVGQELLFSLIVEQSRMFASADNEWTGYSYKVEDGWQGAYKKLRVVGDKRGGGTSMALSNRPELLDRMVSVLDENIQVKVLHIVRNPFDNIATIHRKTQTIELDLDEAVEFYFDMCETNKKVIKELGESSVQTLHLERFIADPEDILTQTLLFLGVQATQEYLTRCAALVFPESKTSRELVDWPEDTKMRVLERCRDFEFLADYRFDS